VSFAVLFESAYIRPNLKGGSVKISNGMSLYKIYSDACDSDIIRILPDYKIHVRKSVLVSSD
jgi:hypothetical protein